MEDLHREQGRVGQPISVVVDKQGNEDSFNVFSDKRLGLFGYTIETINMLLLPMIQDRYVVIDPFSNH